jgi:hypothetical protein
LAAKYLDKPPAGWFVLDVMRKGDLHQRGRPRNEWVALLIDCDPDLYRARQCDLRSPSRWLELGRHRTRDDAWDHAESLIATRH